MTFSAHHDLQVPQYGTEAESTASVLGCTYYVIAAWIWAIIWHMGLDPIKVRPAGRFCRRLGF